MTREQLLDLLGRALVYSGGTHTVEDICTGVAAGQFQMWCAAASVVITQLVDYPQQRDVVFFLAAGDMAEVQHLETKIIAWAKREGCTRASALARPGWSRTFVTKEAGWKSTEMVQYQREL